MTLSAPLKDQYLCGWRVRSEIPLPELAPWAGEDIPPDISITLGSAARPLEEAIDVSPLLQLKLDGTARLSIDAVAHYLLRRGNEIIIDPAPGATGAEIRVFLLGTIFGLLCHWRGLFPLHASCVQIGDGAVAFSGVSGAGKSTLAATMTRRGHRLLSDDVCVIDPDASGGPVVLPAFPRVKLWQDSLEAADIDISGLERNRPGQQKFHYSFDAGNFVTTPVRLKAIYFLGEATGAQPAGIEELRGINRLGAIRGQIYRQQSATVWGLGGRLFRGAGRIANSVAINRLLRGAELATLPNTVRLLEKHIAT